MALAKTLRLVPVQAQKMVRWRARVLASKALHPQASGSRLWLDLLLQEL